MLSAQSGSILVRRAGQGEPGELYIIVHLSFSKHLEAILYWMLFWISKYAENFKLIRAYSEEIAPIDNIACLHAIHFLQLKLS